jgi:hypothetical protein
MAATVGNVIGTCMCVVVGFFLTPDEDTVVSKRRVGKIKWFISKKVLPFLKFVFNG